LYHNNKRSFLALIYSQRRPHIHLRKTTVYTAEAQFQKRLSHKWIFINTRSFYYFAQMKIIHYINHIGFAALKFKIQVLSNHFLWYFAIMWWICTLQGWSSDPNLIVSTSSEEAAGGAAPPAQLHSSNCTTLPKIHQHQVWLAHFCPFSI
jgi:hypothetical protein